MDISITNENRNQDIHNAAHYRYHSIFNPDVLSFYPMGSAHELGEIFGFIKFEMSNAINEMPK
jgi:hypothetical protein